MSNLPDIREIDSTILTDPVRRALDSPTAEIHRWEHHPIRYINTEVSNLGLHRFRGTARVRGEECRWSIVLKAVDAPIRDLDPASWNYHRREILAYEEGLLTELPGGLSAPRCLGIQKFPEGICWLWLEDVLNPDSLPWSLPEYGLVARHLGQFNGAYLLGQPLPTHPWLSQNWMRGWLSYYETSNQEVLGLIQNVHFWEHSSLCAVFPHRITDEILRLWASYPSLLNILDQLPRTYCHLDAYRPNLFLQRELQGATRTIAVDWVFTGIAAVGEEIANLLAASLIWLEYDAADAKSLDEAVFSGYLNGLRDAGWQGDSQLVRLGYTAACTLRWGMVGMWWFRSLGDPDKEAELENHWGHPLTDLASQWAGTTTYLLDLAEETDQLQKKLINWNSG